MRRAFLLLCLPLAACATATLPGEQPAPEAAAAAPPPAASGPAASAPRPAARAAAAASNPAPPPSAPVPSDTDRLTQARVDCWMKVEQQKALRDIDRRIAFVDKCVADQIKAKPQ